MGRVLGRVRGGGGRRMSGTVCLMCIAVSGPVSDAVLNIVQRTHGMFFARGAGKQDCAK